MGALPGRSYDEAVTRNDTNYKQGPVALAFQLGSTKRQPVLKSKRVGRRKEVVEKGRRSVFLRLPFKRAYAKVYFCAL